MQARAPWRSLWPGPSPPRNNVYLDPARQVTEISGDMKASDIIEALAQMRFRNGSLVLRLDKETRYYIVRALRQR